MIIFSPCGYAVGYYGHPRATGDMDIWIAIHPRNAQKLVEALEEFGFHLPNLSPDLFLQEERIIRMISGLQFDECYAKRVMDVIDGIEIKFINLPHLKINKRASGRPKDVNDLQNLP